MYSKACIFYTKNSKSARPVLGSVMPSHHKLGSNYFELLTTYVFSIPKTPQSACPVVGSVVPSQSTICSVDKLCNALPARKWTPVKNKKKTRNYLLRTVYYELICSVDKLCNWYKNIKAEYTNENGYHFLQR